MKKPEKSKKNLCPPSFSLSASSKTLEEVFHLVMISDNLALFLCSF
jgi:hypothetical protein